MGYFTPVTKEVPIDTDDLATASDKVTIRLLSYGERQACISVATTIKTRSSGRGGRGAKSQDAQEAEVTVDGALLATEQAKASLVTWSGPGFEGRAATPENLMLLPPWVVDKVAVAVDALNQGLDDDEKKALAGQ